MMKEFSNRQEHMIAKFLGWKVVSASGARMTPGDVISDNWLGECKTYSKTEHPIIFKKSVWDKISSEAMSVFKNPVYFTDDGSQLPSHTWVMFSGNIPDDMNVTDDTNPLLIRKNIKFDFIDTYRYYKNVDIIKVKFYDNVVYLCDLDTFSRMFKV